MYHDLNLSDQDAENLAKMGTDAIAYMREISSVEIAQRFPEAPQLEQDKLYWAMFAADGTPLVLANAQNELEYSAFYSDLIAVLPN